MRVEIQFGTKVGFLTEPDAVGMWLLGSGTWRVVSRDAAGD